LQRDANNLPNIILVGLPGAGKTTIGRAAAKQLHRPFIDFDTELEHREHATVAEIFAKKGEAYFRGLEESLTEELAGTRGSVISTGGGWVTNPRSVELLRSGGRMIYLRVAPGTALARMAAGRGRRPLLEGPEGVTKMMSLYELRRPLYEAADIIIDTEVIDKTEVIARVRDYALSLK
jgi:shikimate kinase